ncbi:hypothetical protein [uncultured Stenotrophomonas sp.]|uniref:hypothetical protein n=1 Tax=uncultured Stenotrophomonas sp. TaxID=165438 RepID=UPI0025D7D3C8|nr:hypothetical protein [uncultured Stenotrophomonas sp.]
MKNEMLTIARIKADLAKLVAAAPTLKHANGAGRIFELYLVMRLARALKQTGWNVEPLDYKGNAITAGGVYVQRGGAPTGIFPSIAPNGPSSIRIWRNVRDNAFEILNGVQFMGRSTALHEIDIALVPAKIAIALRAGATEDYPLGRPKVSIECKDVGTAGSADEMRSVVARMYDLTILDVHQKYLFGGTLPSGSIFAGAPSGPWTANGKGSRTFLGENESSLCALVRRGGITAGAYQMTGLFHVHTYTKVDRGTQAVLDFVQETTAWIDSNL